MCPFQCCKPLSKVLIDNHSLQWRAAIERANWEEESETVLESLPLELLTIMSDRGSLTTALKNIGSTSFKVEVIQERLEVPYLSESSRLGLDKSKEATVRQVQLCIFEKPVVFARSVIPYDLTKRTATGLASLGSKPLGHLLFKDGIMKKSRREFACVEGIYGRRTPYEYEGGLILVNEFFLDGLVEFL